MIERLTEKGITVLIATHDIEYACGWADEIVLMHEGKVIRHAETMEICQDEEALKEAELEIPTVIRMYRKFNREKNSYQTKKSLRAHGKNWSQGLLDLKSLK